MRDSIVGAPARPGPVRRRWLPLLLAAGAAAAPLAGPAAGQSVRVTGTTNVRLVQVRPLVEDSVAAEATIGDGILRRAADGRLVRCLGEGSTCRYYRSGDTEVIAPFHQDLALTGWGFGRGLRVFARLRMRVSLAGDGGLLWPRGGDALDALEGYLELDRGAVRVRAGRQWPAAAPAWASYDGLSLRYRPGPAFSAELYGGRGLAPGIHEPRDAGALEAIEALAPDEPALLLGARIQARPARAFGVNAAYQREIRSDRMGLYAERLALDAVARHGRGTVEGTLRLDLGGRALNEAALRGSFRAGRAVDAGALLRRFRPFFELWTIWGAFDPVGYDEAGAWVAWGGPSSPLAVEANASWRRYDEAAGSTLTPLRSDGLRLGAGISAPLGPVWRARAGGSVDAGFGALGADGHVSLERALGPEGHVAASAVAFQRAYEFRVEEGVVVGLAVDAGARIAPRGRLAGSLALYRHTGAGTAADVDWSQLRGSLRFEWTVGPEPGLTEGGVRR